MHQLFIKMATPLAGGVFAITSSPARRCTQTSFGTEEGSVHLLTVNTF